MCALDDPSDWAGLLQLECTTSNLNPNAGPGSARGGAAGGHQIRWGAEASARTTYKVCSAIQRLWSAFLTGTITLTNANMSFYSVLYIISWLITNWLKDIAIFTWVWEAMIIKEKLACNTCKREQYNESMFCNCFYWGLPHAARRIWSAWMFMFVTGRFNVTEIESLT